MNWDAIIAVTEIMGVIAVIASLVYVSIQIRQNTDAMRMASAQSLLSVSTTSHQLLASDNRLADIIQTALADNGTLSASDQLRFNAIYIAAYNQYDFAYRQHQKGQLDPDTWERMEMEMLLYIHLPAGAAWWSQIKTRFSRMLVEFVDDKLITFRPPPTIPTLGESADAN